ncbi:MAG: hypothetical protein JWM21_4547 [Acidobacteria bacterium]|nr:hypothetical protein [Acidobacteriota bacterium]
MNRTSVLLLVTCCLTSTPNWTIDAQTTKGRADRTITRNTIGPKRRSRAKTSALSDRGGSTVGLDLHCLTKDADDNIWAGGSAFLQRGLLLRFDGKRIHPTLIPETWGVRKLSFISRDHGWMIADRHDLYGTSDGGLSWQKADLDLGPNPPNLETLFFSDAEHGWVGGWRGTIYHTNDGGLSWRRQESSTNLDINRLTFVNHLQGWAGAWKFGEGSALITTSDGGSTWKTILPDSMLYNFTFVDDFEGWALDEERGIVHTVDGGETWNVQRQPNATMLRLLFFLNKREGWVIGADALLHTVDGGQIWKRLNNEGLPFNPEDILFTDSVHGWAAETFGANLFRTNDAGITWEPISAGWQHKVADEVHQTVSYRGKNAIK